MIRPQGILEVFCGGPSSGLGFVAFAFGLKGVGECQIGASEIARKRPGLGDACKRLNARRASVSASSERLATSSIVEWRKAL